MKATSDYLDKSTASIFPDDADELRKPLGIEFSLTESNISGDVSAGESGDVHIEGLDSEVNTKPRAARTTDLVRL